jgi:putative SOS response-associated peptidase YedK
LFKFAILFVNGYARSMCGRYSFFDTEQLYERYEVPRGKEQLRDRYNVAPGSEMPVIAGGEERHVEVLRWGITPKWAKEKGGRGLINARAETVAEKPTFKKLFESSRCLVPARGWFEWMRANGKQPYYFHLRDKSIFSFAGLCDDDEYLILTTAAIPGLKKVHHRMPVVLERGEEKEWLNPDFTEVDQLRAALEMSRSDKFDVYPVSKAVNLADQDAASLIDRA